MNINRYDFDGRAETLATHIASHIAAKKEKVIALLNQASLSCLRTQADQILSAQRKKKLALKLENATKLCPK